MLPLSKQKKVRRIYYPPPSRGGWLIFEGLSRARSKILTEKRIAREGLKKRENSGRKEYMKKGRRKRIHTYTRVSKGKYLRRLYVFDRGPPTPGTHTCIASSRPHVCVDSRGVSATRLRAHTHTRAINDAMCASKKKGRMQEEGQEGRARARSCLPSQRESGVHTYIHNRIESTTSRNAVDETAISESVKIFAMANDGTWTPSSLLFAVSSRDFDFSLYGNHRVYIITVVANIF